jgi:hypothetical protein
MSIVDNMIELRARLEEIEREKLAEPGPTTTPENTPVFSPAAVMVASVGHDEDVYAQLCGLTYGQAEAGIMSLSQEIMRHDGWPPVQPENPDPILPLHVKQRRDEPWHLPASVHRLQPDPANLAGREMLPTGMCRPDGGPFVPLSDVVIPQEREPVAVLLLMNKAEMLKAQIRLYTRLRAECMQALNETNAKLAMLQCG